MQARSNPFVVMAGLYLTVGLLAVAGRLSVGAGLVESLPRIRWLTVHLVTIGGLTQALFGMLPALARGAAGADRGTRLSSRWLQ